MARNYDIVRETELTSHIWRTAKKRVFLRPIDTNSRILAPKQWEVNETYLPGAVVADENGDLWISWRADNYGNEPGATNAWDSYYGPMAVQQWSEDVSYNAGELVWKQGASAGTFVVYLSLATSNTDTPDTATAWSATTTYGLNDRVSYGGNFWRSIISNNLNLTPAEPPNDYSDSVEYDDGDTVVASDGFIYEATTNDTIGVDPIDDDGTFWTKGIVAAWSMDPELFSASPKWMPLYADLTNVPGDWLYIKGNKNVFRLPANILRRARLNYRERRAPDDYVPMGDYIVSSDAQITLDFCANIKDVSKMDTLLCEVIAAKLAWTTCEKLTGSRALLSDLVSIHKKYIFDASAINAIEMGPEEPDEDEFILVREYGGASSGFSQASTNWWGW
ncbi:hypothetical protein [Reyranella sp.]